MKACFALLVILFSVSSYAIDCPVQFGNEDYMDKVREVIESKQTCREANELTQACAMGSSMDVQFVSSALKMCNKRIISSTTRNKKLVASANKLCVKKYAKSQGTLAMSLRAFCTLDVAVLFDSLLTKSDL